MSAAANPLLAAIIGVPAWLTTYDVVRRDLFPPPPTATSTAVAGACAGVVLSASSALGRPDGRLRPARALFPELPDEYVRNLPQERPSRLALRAAVAHAAFFTVYEGLLGPISRATTSSSSSSSSEGGDSSSSTSAASTSSMMVAATRFLAGGVASLALRAAAAAASGTADSERRVAVSALAAARPLARGFVLAGAAMSAYGA
ncbi:hypothetical protein HK405_001457, partial [Cladochytrium tenue]